MARILVADDSVELRTLLGALLAETGHTVAVASNGLQAMEMMREHPPDLLILDVMMPRLDGYGVLKEIKNNPVLRDGVKTLVLTAKASEPDIVKGYKLGADQYLTKPFDGDELLGAVQQMLETPKNDMRGQSEQDLETAQLLSRLESLFSDL